MKPILVVEPAAEQDILRAYQWYEVQQTGLGSRFLGALDSAFSTMLEHPNLYEEAIPGVHRAVTRSFPYLIFYTIENSELHVLAVLHAAQNPAIAAGRI